MRRLLLLALASLALPSFAAQTGHAVYRPGLTQARIPLGSEWGYITAFEGVPNLASNLLELVDEGKADWIDRTLDVFKDGEHKKNGGRDDDPNPLSGMSWTWSEAIQNNHAVFAYEGEMFVEEGTEYYFFGRMWTGEALVLDGTTVVWQGGGNSWKGAPLIYGFWTAPKTGWVPFNGWLWTWNGGSGDPQWSEWGLQYNTVGFSLEGLGEETAPYSPPPDMQGIRYYSKNEYTNIWKRFVDPGNGTFLRTATTNRFTAATTADGRTWNLTFEGVPHAAQLVAFWGPTDGIHDAAVWESHSTDLVDVPAGDSSRTVSVSPEANATALRFRLAYADATSTNGMEVFEEWTEAFPLSDAPVVRVDAVRPGFTNVVVSGELAALGRDGAAATVTIQIANAADESFADPISTNLPASSIAGPFEVLVQGIETNAAYLVRAIATATSCATSSVVSFRTARPTPAVATAEIIASKFFEADVAAEVSDWGAGATGAEVWIDVSASSNFPAGETQTISLGVLSGHLPKIEVGEVAGLEPDTAYFARIRLDNSWGLESESPSVELRTSSVPLVFSEPEASSANGWASVSLATNYVATGTVYSVHLSAASQAFTQSRDWSVPSDEPPFEWSVPASSGQSVHFRFEISWSNRDFSSGSDPIVIEADTTWTSEADYTMTLQELDAFRTHPGRPNLYLRPGETVALVPSTNDVTIAWHTNAVVSISEKGILTALEPGATLLYEQDSSGQTNNVIGAVIVLPAEDPAGGIYLHRTLNDFSWNDTNEWEVVAQGPKAYPNAPGAWAYVVTPPEYTYHGPNHPLEVTEEIKLGGLVIGQVGWIHHKWGTSSELAWIIRDQSNSGGALVFDAGKDESNACLRLAGHSHITSHTVIEIPIRLESDLDIDEMNRVQDTTGWRSYREWGLYLNGPVDVGDHTLRTIRTNPFPFHYVSGGHAGGSSERGWMSFRNDVLGSGLIRLEAATQVGLLGSVGRLKSFTGTWDVANGDMDPHVNVDYGGCSFNISGGSLGNAKEMIIRGSWHRAEKTWSRGALVRTGFMSSKDISAWTNNWSDALPPSIILDGGVLQLYPQGSGASSTWRNDFTISNLAISAGSMGRLESRFTNNNGGYLSGRPNVFTTITNLVLEPNAVVSFDYDASTASVQNEFIIVNESNNWGWVPTAEATQQFLPFFFANNQREGTGGDTLDLMSFTILDNTRLAFRDRETGKVSLGTPDETPDSIGNYRRWTAGETLANGNSYFSMQLASNVTNAFEEGATVQNLAGYVDMRKGAALGRPGEDAGATLDFGDQPARIFNGNWGEVGTIGCRLAGTAGLVTGGNGTIALGASAEGVAGGVRVAGGTLELLNRTVRLANGTDVVARGRIAGDIRVEAGSRLVVHGAACINPGSTLFLNDRDWIPSVGHVQLLDPSRPVYVRDLVVGGKALPHGYYGSSASGAEHADDVHFEGPGVLYAGTLPTLMIFR